jgi:hypothetical protein
MILPEIEILHFSCYSPGYNKDFILYHLKEMIEDIQPYRLFTDLFGKLLKDPISRS